MPDPVAPSVRLAEASDLAAVKACVEAAYRPYEQEIGVAPGPLFDDYAALIAERQVRVFEAEEGIVGIFVMFLRGDHILLDNAAFLPAWQNRGLGKLCLELALGEARRRGIGILRLYTNAKMTRNIALYRRRGFVETGRRTEKGFDRVYMELQVR